MMSYWAGERYHEVTLGQGQGWYHNKALGQAGTGQEVDDAQPLREPQISEGGWLQGDGVRCGRAHSQLPLKACRPCPWLSWRQAGLWGQPLVQVRQLWGHSAQGCSHLLTAGSHTAWDEEGGPVPLPPCGECQWTGQW